jgi:drug/metabolite transporter (DMT)-like permease
MTGVVLLSLCSAIAYGLSDFIGGVLARRSSAWAVAAASQAAAMILALAMVLTSPIVAPAASLAWGAAGGIGASAGNVLIYRGLGLGRMSVVAPVSALASAALPVLVGLVTGEQPGMQRLAGVGLALPAVWLVSGGGAGFSGIRGADAVNGLAAGLGFGLQFSALGQIPSSAGWMPLALSQVVSVSGIVLAAIALSAPWVPRDRHSRLGTVAGVLAGVATILFQLATQAGLLTIAGVLASLYPAATVMLAAFVLRERIQPSQGAGLALAAAAVGLIAAG